MRLKNCPLPWCKGPSKFRTDPAVADYPATITIQCQTCGLERSHQLKPEDAYDRVKAVLFNDWNNRQPDDEPKFEQEYLAWIYIECPVCSGQGGSCDACVGTGSIRSCDAYLYKGKLP